DGFGGLSAVAEPATTFAARCTLLRVGCGQKNVVRRTGRRDAPRCGAGIWSREGLEFLPEGAVKRCGSPVWNWRLCWSGVFWFDGEGIDLTIDPWLPSATRDVLGLFEPAHDHDRLTHFELAVFEALEQRFRTLPKGRDLIPGRLIAARVL